MATTLAAFVAGVLLLQQCAALPSSAALAAIAGCAAATIGSAVALGRRRALLRRAGAALAAALIGFGYAAVVAQLRLADQLDFKDEGREVQVTGIVAAMPVHGERGVRFAFDVQAVEPPDVHVPEHIFLTWYQPSEVPRPAEQWRFSVRLRRPHGTFNPAGFDSELWMLELGVRAAGYVRDGAGATAPRRLAPTVWRPNAMIDRVRDRLRECLQQVLQQRRHAGVI
jgi:competence protein ComEC